MIKSQPRDYFLYIGSFVSLLFLSININNVAAAVGNLMVRFTKLPDFYQTGNKVLVHGIVLLISSTIVFVVAQFFINRDIRNNSDKKDLTLRKAYLYGCLFVFGYLLFSQVNGLVIHLLGVKQDYGHVVVRLVTVIVSVIFLLYFIYDLRRKNFSSILPLISAILLLVYVLTLWCLGVHYSVMVNKVDQDKNQLMDLQKIQGNILSYWYANKMLPNQISDLNIGGYAIPKNQFTGQDYEYLKTAERRFKLCGDFIQGSEIVNPLTYPNYNESDVYKWDHPQGHYCFERYLNPENYPTTTPKREAGGEG